jgi:hypothetical protein
MKSEMEQGSQCDRGHEEEGKLGEEVLMSAIIGHLVSL